MNRKTKGLLSLVAAVLFAASSHAQVTVGKD